MWTLWPYLKHSTYICKNIASILISADVNFEMPRSPFFFNLCAILAVGGLSTWWMSNEIRHQDIMVTIIQTFSWQAFLPSDTLGSLIKTFACDLSTQQYIWHLFHHALHKYGYCCLFVRLCSTAPEISVIAGLIHVCQSAWIRKIKTLLWHYFFVLAFYIKPSTVSSI